ncbi:hypothetical protein IMCC26134_06895 [Verrucomicrobia bacterium IMCC26134]|jgi:hypothetical protein|nr:hypothetical protein IMCC26134_06895 [Verrucomicrobia bacterium IMCC26134]
MQMTPHDSPVDWDQLTDLLGESDCDSQRAVLLDMWCDMIDEVRRELTVVGELCTDAEMKLCMHRLRGVVSMWGLIVLARRMQAVEKAPSPLVEWRSECAAIIEMFVVSQRKVSERHPWLDAGGVT